MRRARYVLGTRLLILFGASPFCLSVQSRWTALIVASVFGHTDTAQMLVDAGARRDVKDKRGKTALDCAKEKGHTAIVALLSAPPTSLPSRPSPRTAAAAKEDDGAERRRQKDEQLWNAAKDDKQAEARSLLAAGANPDGHKSKVSRPTD